ncbi:alcohol dehydrogenase catalytic domain-containing protein [Mesorhizobium sp. 43Arga]
MKAALLKSYGDIDQFVIEEVSKPKPQTAEILIKIAASAVNPFDLLLRQGFVPQYIPLQLPAMLGGDAAGIIAELGAAVTEFSVGDRVVADFAANGKGAHAEYGVVPATACCQPICALSRARPWLRPGSWDSKR